MSDKITRINLALFWGTAKVLFPIATLRHVAGEMAITPSYLGKLIRGEHPWTTPRMQDCAKALDLEVADLFEEVEAPAEIASGSTSLRTVNKKDISGG